MMKNILFISAMFLLSSCWEKGYVKVQNNVHNVQLESISWGEYAVYSSLLPGETSEDVKIQGWKDDFPKSYPLEFYMTGNGNTVYLKTKEKYTLDAGQSLYIIISDSTPVINPLQ